MPGQRPPALAPAREGELLPTRYVHAVFTLPRELAPVALENKKVVFDLLFHARAETLLEVVRSIIGAEPANKGPDGADAAIAGVHRRIQIT